MDNRGEGLFRKEAIDAQRGNRLGSIQLQAPRFGWAFVAAGVLVVLLVFLLLAFGHYTRHERVDGALGPEGGLLTLTALAPGVVVHALVAEGAQVHAGQPVVEISGEQDSATLGNTRAAVVAQ